MAVMASPYPEETLRQFADAGIQADALRVAMKNARRSLGDIMVGEAPREFDKDPENVLVDVEECDGGELLATYEKQFAVFETTPVDPTGDRLRLYPGGLTIWSGFPGAGKTTLLRQIACHLLKSGAGVFLASLEENPKTVLVMLAATAAGAQLPNKHQMQWFVDAYGKRLRLWGNIGIAEHRAILATIRQLAAEGVTHAVIDSLMCLDIANDDFERQRQFANLLAATARTSNVHIHLVAHPRKLMSANQDLDINDVAGARELGGIVDNVIFVRRKGETQVSGDASPMLVSIKKLRSGGEIGDIQGWYRRKLRQFTPGQFDNATRYLPEDAYT